MKTIKRMHNLQEAKIIVGFLNAHGIDAELMDGAINAVLPAVTGRVRIAVPVAQEAEALTLLANAESGGAALDDGDQE
jgi:putative signal transducing protein